MSKSMKKSALSELQQIPGVGKKISENLWNLGFRSVRDLKDKDPEKLYNKLCLQKGMYIDKCVLYVFRCAVYYASKKRHKPELLKWWNWKDEK